jgi:MYXO-CTERM domain-containing protein
MQSRLAQEALMRLSAIAWIACLTFTGVANAAVLTVGTGKQYATPCAAIAAAQPGDEIDVDAATYTDTCEINVANLTLKGVGGQPKMDLSGTNHPADYKGIFVVQADNVRIENFELTGAHIDPSQGENGAGIRVSASGLVVHGCYIHDNQDGILGSPLTAGQGTLTIENSELYHNGLGNGCTDGNGCTHNVYAGNWGKLVFQYNYSHGIAQDGHLVKSRAYESDILYNRITGEDGGDSFEIDLPNGGLAIVVGNEIEKGPKANNAIVINYGEEGLVDPDKRLFVVGNTMVNDLGKGTFINVAAGGTLTAHDNLLVGAGTPASTGALSADNLVEATAADAMFVDVTKYDYHLTAASPARGKAVDPGAVDGRPLAPTMEYVHPRSAIARATENDVGAFEYGNTGATPDGGAGGGDGGVGADGGDGSGGDTGMGGGGSGGGGGGAGDMPGGTAPKHGCSFGDGDGDDAAVPFALLVVAAVLLMRRRSAL